MKVFDLRGMEINEDFLPQTEPTKCLACGKEVIVVRAGTQGLELVYANEKDFPPVLYRGREAKTGKTNIHDGYCLGVRKAKP